jgi:hypothetical protein
MGQGIISVSEALFEPHEPMVDGISMTDKEHIVLPQTLAEWHALLMLPEEYKVLEVKADAVYPLWLITVENDAIPVVKGKKLSNVTPIFCVEDNEDGTRKGYYLDRIEIDKPKHRVIWQRLAKEQA